MNGVAGTSDFVSSASSQNVQAGKASNGGKTTANHLTEHRQWRNARNNATDPHVFHRQGRRQGRHGRRQMRRKRLNYVESFLFARSHND